MRICPRIGNRRALIYKRLETGIAFRNSCVENQKLESQLVSDFCTVLLVCEFGCALEQSAQKNLALCMGWDWGVEMSVEPYPSNILVKT